MKEAIGMTMDNAERITEEAMGMTMYVLHPMLCTLPFQTPCIV